MNTGEKRRERVCALADGELDEGEIDPTLLSLRQTESKDDWELYHQIGDILRSEEMATIKLSSDFARRMSSRLDQEPIFIAPSTDFSRRQLATKGVARKSWLLPGIAAAAIVITVSAIGIPHMFEGSTNDHALASSKSIDGAQTDSHDGEGVVLRDPRIDDYVLAHQRFSPSVYSTAQYARSTTFEADSNK